jgi:hypothetical protein
MNLNKSINHNSKYHIHVLPLHIYHCELMTSVHMEATKEAGSLCQHRNRLQEQPKQLPLFKLSLDSCKLHSMKNKYILQSMLKARSNQQLTSHFFHAGIRGSAKHCLLGRDTVTGVWYQAFRTIIVPAFSVAL